MKYIKPTDCATGQAVITRTYVNVQTSDKWRTIYLAGRWSWGRLYGVQIGSPTKRRIA